PSSLSGLRVGLVRLTSSTWGGAGTRHGVALTARVPGAMMRGKQSCRRGVRMKRFEDRITITAPRERVFSYVSDFPRHGEWAANNLNVAAEGDGPVAVGSTYSTEAKQFGTQREKSTVTELTPGQVFGWDSK